MKFILGFILLASIQANSSMASTLQDVSEGNYHGTDFLRKCELIISQNGSEMQIEALKGSRKFLLENISVTREISASDNNQVWIDIHKSGMIYLRIFFNNETELKPTSYKIMEGRTTILEKCNHLE